MIRTMVRPLAVALILVGALGLGRVAVAADHYDFDEKHQSFVFKVRHAGVSDTYGRFNSVKGDIAIDKTDPSKSSFSISIAADSIDTGQTDRDKHLRSPDFFDAKQFPALTFKSTSVKAIEGGYEVAGNMTIRNITKPLTLKLKYAEGEFPPGTPRIGLTTETTLKRSDYGVGKPNPAVGDDVAIVISFEATKKK